MWRASSLLVLLALCALAVGTTAALAHATLVSSDPADGAILRDAPSRFVLTFNEPVSPLVIRLVDPDGSATALSTRLLEEAVLTLDLPHALRPGTHALAWRVVSADGHPVGGSLIFSIGAMSPGALPDVAEVADWPLRMSIWTARVLIYSALRRRGRPVPCGFPRTCRLAGANSADGHSFHRPDRACGFRRITGIGRAWRSARGTYGAARLADGLWRKLCHRRPPRRACAADRADRPAGETDLYSSDARVVALWLSAETHQHRTCGAAHPQ